MVNLQLTEQQAKELLHALEQESFDEVVVEMLRKLLNDLKNVN